MLSICFFEEVQRWVQDNDNAEALDLALDALQRVVAASEACQTLIKIVDCSKLGWQVIQHYVVDPIADCIEDENHTKNAMISTPADMKVLQKKRGAFETFSELALYKLT